MIHHTSSRIGKEARKNSKEKNIKQRTQRFLFEFPYSNIKANKGKAQDTFRGGKLISE